VTRPLAAGFVALAIAAALPGCASSSTTRPTATAASLVPSDVIAFVSYASDPPSSQRSALTTALTPKGGPRPTFAAARSQLLAGIGKPLGIDVGKDVAPWATGDIALAVLRDRQAVLVATVGNDSKAAAALGASRLAHRRIGRREVMAKRVAALDELPKGGEARLSDTYRYARAVAAAPGERLGVGMVDANACRRGAGGRFDFSIRAAARAVEIDGIASGTVATAATGPPTATDHLPVDTLASLTTFDGRAINDVADAALGCVPSASSTPSIATVVSTGLPPGAPANFGIDIDGDVMPWLRGETVISLGPPRSPVAVADVGFVTHPGDLGRAGNALTKIENMLALTGQFQWVSRDQAGVNFLSVPQSIAGVPGLQPSVAIAGGRVLLASSPEYLLALANPKQPTIGSSSSYQDDVAQPHGQVLGRVVLHLAAMRDLFGGKLPLLATIADPLIARADTVVLTLAREQSVSRFRLLVRYAS